MTDESPTALLDLPHDLLTQVLSHINQPSYSRARLTCKRFRDALDASPHLEVTVKESAWAAQPAPGRLLRRIKPISLRAQLSLDALTQLNGLVQACAMLQHLTLVLHGHQQASCLPMLLKACAAHLHTLRVKSRQHVGRNYSMQPQGPMALPVINVMPVGTATTSAAALAVASPGQAAATSSTQTAAFAAHPAQSSQARNVPSSFSLPHLSTIVLAGFWLWPSQLLASAATTAPALRELSLQYCTLDITDWAGEGLGEGLGRGLASAFPALEVLGLDDCRTMRVAPRALPLLAQGVPGAAAAAAAAAMAAMQSAGATPTTHWQEVTPSLLDGMEALSMQLKTLELSQMPLEILPPQFFQLTGLSQLSLNRIELVSVPDAISGLTQLTALSLKGNDLPFFPSAITKLSQLRVLDVSDNPQLRAQLPRELPQMPSLRQLITDWHGRPQRRNATEAGGDWVWPEELGEGMAGTSTGHQGPSMQQARARQAPLAMNQVDMLLARAVGFLR